LIFMHFHDGLLGRQHEMWSKQHNGKVRPLTLAPRSFRPVAQCRVIPSMLATV
jgi:hypothetical protein